MTAKKWRILIPIFREPAENQREIFDPVAHIINKPYKNKDQLKQMIDLSDAIIVTMETQLDREVLDAASNLKVIGKYGVGTENIDIKAASEHGTVVTNVPLINTNAVADLTIGLILALLRRIQPAKNLMRTGEWQKAKFIGRELKHKTIGIIGYGNIAKLVIQRLQGFDVKKILVFSESKKEQTSKLSSVNFVDLKTLLKNSDIISIHKALTDGSKGMIGEKELRIIPESSFLINTSRGPVVEESALIRALKKGRLAGAALDVYENEPLPMGSPLFDLENVVMTPHMGGVTWEARTQMVEILARNIVTLLQGNLTDPQYIVNPDVLKKSSLQRVTGEIED